MQTVRFAELLDDIYKKLYVPELLECLWPIANLRDTGPNIQIHTNKARFHDLIFKARDNLAFLNQDPDAKSILEEFGLLEAFDPNLIGRMLTIFQMRPSRDDLRNNASDFAVILFFSATIKAFQQLRSGISKLITERRMTGLEANETSIEFEMLDLGLKGFDLERLEAIFPLIDDLFKQLCKVYGIKEQSPRILYMDSGSGLVISLKGPAEIINALRKLFVTVWDKIRFKKYDEIEKKLETVDSTLEVLQKIKQSEASGDISSEDSARLTHLITKDVFGLLEKGTSLREIQKKETFENRTLLTDMVEVKYLTDAKKLEDPPSA